MESGHLIKNKSRNGRVISLIQPRPQRRAQDKGLARQVGHDGNQAQDLSYHEGKTECQVPMAGRNSRFIPASRPGPTAQYRGARLPWARPYNNADDESAYKISKVEFFCRGSFAGTRKL